MIDFIDPTLRASRSSQTETKAQYTFSIVHLAIALIVCTILFFIFLTATSRLDTQPEQTIEIDQNLRTDPSEQYPAGRLPAIPTSPRQNP